MLHNIHSDIWYVYILECADGTLYTGATNNLERRLAQHNTGQGAKYTRGRGPLRLMYSSSWPGKSQALREEYRIKQLTRGEKLKLIKT